MGNEHDSSRGFHGPRCWIVSALVGAAVGFLLTVVMPATPAVIDHGSPGEDQPALVVQTRSDGSRVLRTDSQQTLELSPVVNLEDPREVRAIAELHESSDDTVTPQTDPAAAHGQAVPLWLCVPFGLLLLSIAVMPFISERFWHHHFPDFAFLFGAMVLVYCTVAYGAHGRHIMLHAGLEYYAFIALVGGLYVASGGILVDVRVRGRALTNTALLALGAVLANIVGTTGASVLLIRPFMRMNRVRLRPLHVVFFIFIVSNCAGSLTPIGDPPLYLGYLKGVPFFWTLTHLWPMWVALNGSLLAIFFVVDSRIPPAPELELGEHDPHEHRPIIAGFGTLGFLALLVAGVFIDPLLRRHAGFEGFPIGATFQIVVAAAAYFTARPSIHHANQFTFAPVKEVGFLFVGIFLTMAPALEYLAAHAAGLGLESPTQFYFGTGGLSGVLDNAPTYLSFLQVAFGVLHLPLTPAGVSEFIVSTFDVVHPRGDAPAEIIHFNGLRLLEAISLGAVFFGAMTYIGNGPNFMVKSIVESARAQGSGLGVRTPSFFGYLGWAMLILLPLLIATWAVFIR